MKKWPILLGLGLAMLCLCGCEDLATRTARMEDLALLRVLAVDEKEGGISVTTTTGKAQQQSTLILHGYGMSLGEACLSAREMGEAYPIYSYVDEILVGEALAKQGLSGLLDHLERDVELRLSSRLWLLRGEAEKALTEDLAEGTVERLAMLAEMAGVGSNGLARTAGELIMAQDRSEDSFLPALELTEEGKLRSAGYGVLKEGRLVCYLEGDCAMGVSLMLEAQENEMIGLILDDGQRASVRLGDVSCRFGGRFEGDRVVGLVVRCSLKGVAVQLPEGWKWSEERQQTLEDQLARWAEDCIRQSVAMMQSVQADPLELGRRMGLSAPWRWDGIAGQWKEVFPQLDVEVEAEAKVER